MLTVLLGYVAGSLPFAFWLARRRGVDVRVSGSGNVGAANVLRTTGAAPAAAVMALDVLKGALAVGIAHLANAGVATTAATGAAAVLGHVYPVWLRFHGGKGVAVAAGVFAVLTPAATVAAAVTFVFIVAVTRYVSLGSVVATVSLPPAVWLTGAPATFVVTAAAVAALIVFRHRGNIRRLWSGTERRIGVAG